MMRLLHFLLIVSNVAIKLIRNDLLSILESSNIKKENLLDERSLQYHGTTTLAIRYQDSIIICVDSRASMGDYIGSHTVKKILPISHTAIATMAGGAADCAFWIKNLAQFAKQYEITYNEKVRVSTLAKVLAEEIKKFKELDLSLGTMICGWDPVDKASIYYVDSNGLWTSGPVFCVGSGSTFAYSVLDSEMNTIETSPDVNQVVDIVISAVRGATLRDAFSGGYITVMQVNSTGCYHLKRIDSRSLNNKK